MEQIILVVLSGEVRLCDTIIIPDGPSKMLEHSQKPICSNSLCRKCFHKNLLYLITTLKLEVVCCFVCFRPSYKICASLLTSLCTSKHLRTSVNFSLASMPLGRKGCFLHATFSLGPASFSFHASAKINRIGTAKPYSGTSLLWCEFCALFFLKTVTPILPCPYIAMIITF